MYRAIINASCATKTVPAMGFIILPSPEYCLVHYGNAENQSQESSKIPASFSEFFPDYPGILNKAVKRFAGTQENLYVKVIRIVEKVRS